MISNTLTQASLQLENLKNEIEKNERFKGIYGDLKVAKKWNQEEVELRGQIKIFARGQGQQIRGLKYLQYRPDLVILDDLEDNELVLSQERREALKRWLHSEVYPALDVTNGRIIYIGTILHHDSLLNNVLDPTKYKEWYKRRYKAIQDDGEHVLWEDHLNLKDLEAIKKNAIESGAGHLFYAEYQNEPRDSEVQFFRREDWRYYKPEDLQNKLLNTFSCADLAVSREKRADFSVIVTVSLDQAGNYYIREIRRGKWSPKEIVDQLFLVNSMWSPLKIGIEDGVEWKTLKPYVEDETVIRRTYLPLEEIKHGGQSKLHSSTRVRGLDPLYKKHIMFHPEGGANVESLEEELFMFPSGKHDDIIDALAYILRISQLPGDSISDYADNNFTAYGAVDDKDSYDYFGDRMYSI